MMRRKELEIEQAVERVEARVLSREEIFRAALGLHQEDRGKLAAALLDSLEPESVADPNEVALAWEAEVERRIAEVEAGRMELIPWPEARRRLRAMVNAARED